MKCFCGKGIAELWERQRFAIIVSYNIKHVDNDFIVVISKLARSAESGEIYILTTEENLMKMRILFQKKHFKKYSRSIMVVLYRKTTFVLNIGVLYIVSH